MKLETNLKTLALALMSAASLALAHMGEDHDEAQPTDHHRGMVMSDSSKGSMDTAGHPSEMPAPEAQAKDSSLTGFPTLHPLAVHFPIVLLPTGFVLLALGVAFRNPGMKLAGWGTGSAGTIGAWISSTILHVHTMGLTSAPMAVFENHEHWAARTIWIATAATAVGIVRFFWKKGGIWLEGAGIALLLASSIAVAVTGHYGACLTHLHGVGPMGHHLMLD